jgi:hypothetical protein
MRFYLDLHDDRGVRADDEGMELRGVEAAEVEAAVSLVDMVKAAVRRKCQGRMTVEVRTADGPHFQAIFELKTLQ